MTQETIMETRDDILKKHVAKYYHHKGRNLNDDDILPLSRVKPILDEYSQLKVSEATAPLLERVKELENELQSWKKTAEQAQDLWQSKDLTIEHLNKAISNLQSKLTEVSIERNELLEKLE